MRVVALLNGESTPLSLMVRIKGYLKLSVWLFGRQEWYCVRFVKFLCLSHCPESF